MKVNWDASGVLAAGAIVGGLVLLSLAYANRKAIVAAPYNAANAAAAAVSDEGTLGALVWRLMPWNWGAVAQERALSSGGVQPDSLVGPAPAIDNANNGNAGDTVGIVFGGGA